MARPRKCKRVCNEPAYDCFSPDGISVSGECFLSVEEFEVLRLIDYERLTQEQCAIQMGIGRTTVTEMYDKVHYKIADSIVYGKKIIIRGGNYQICTGNLECEKYKSACCKRYTEKNNEKNDVKINEVITMLNKKGENQMRVAVTYDNGEIFQHFGHTEKFKVYDISDGKIVNEQVVDTNGKGHGALAEFLFSGKVDTLICGGIGGGAQNALKNAGIKLYGGISGSADEAVKALAAGKLECNDNISCSHHEHGEGSHECGDHGCGNHGCH